MLYICFANRTQREAKRDTWTAPTFLDDSLAAMIVENMTALELQIIKISMAIKKVTNKVYN